MASIFEKQIKKQLESEIQGITPGLVIQAFHEGQKKIDIEVGETYEYYDWASITKPIFGTTLMMHMYDENPKTLEEKVLKYLDWYVQPKLDIRQLLTHTSGLTWWKPLYHSLNISQNRQDKWNHLKHIIASEPLEEKPQAVYSDLNAILIGYILESFFKKDLIQLFDIVKEAFNLKKTFFHPDNIPYYAKEKYAPTEECPWRQRRLQGEVHDENAWALGGVAPQSGLFGPIEDLSSWILKLREVVKTTDTNFLLSPATIHAFMQRAISQEMGDWALGFMMKSLKDSTCGQFFSKKSIGHTGFTGTSFWWDPEKDLIVCVLSNRVYNGRQNGNEFKKIRQKIHDLIYQAVIK